MAALHPAAAISTAAHVVRTRGRRADAFNPVLSTTTPPRRLAAPAAHPAPRLPSRAAVRPSPLPPIASHELHESTIAEVLLAQALPFLTNSHERLQFFLADREHEPAAVGELADQRSRHLRCSRRHDNRVERRLVAPAERAVADADRDVVIAELVEELPRGRGEARDTLD